MNGYSSWLFLLAALAAVATATIAGLPAFETSPGPSELALSEKKPAADSSRETPAAQERPRHPVVINHPQGPPRIATGKLDALGREITLSCGSCHANRQPNVDTKRGEELKEFHQSLTFAHGSLRCVSCHNPGDYNSLRLAEGRSLPFSQVQMLCSQCHTPQARDYEHGAHGGMNGYWDLTRGPRQRKSCIDCHDPHAPKFPGMVPTFKSRDRFLAPLHEGEPHE